MADKVIVKETETEVVYEDGTGMVRLIGAGWAKAWPASDVKVGQYRLYNYGHMAPITKVEDKGNWRHITVTEKGIEYTRKSRPSSIIPIAYWVK